MLVLCYYEQESLPPAIVASAQDIVDGVIELKTEESVEGITRSLRVLKMLGAKHLTTWMPYDISDDAKFIQPSQRKLG